MTKQTRPNNSSATPTVRMAIGIVLILLAAGIWYISSRPEKTGSAVQFTHIHGLGFSPDGRQLMVPAHDGILIYSGGHWTASDLPTHDYMGFSVTNTGFYSSGHPAFRSNKINPLGLISNNGDQVITTHAFEGEFDFHIMGVGYQNHAVYVFNPSATASLPTGLNYTLDDGRTWIQSQAQGLSGNPVQIAVHPTESTTIAVATENGLFLSYDGGNVFTSIVQNAPVSAVSFAPDGNTLVFGYQSLTTYALETSETVALHSPDTSDNDPIGFIAIHPLTQEIAITTFNKDIYLSSDTKQTWKQIVKQGIG